MKTCFVSIDVESDFARNENFKGVKNLDRILNIFRKYDIEATLFVTGNVLETHTEQIKQWSKDYEIACHGFSHKFWSGLGNQERKQELDKSINLYRNIFNQNPKGFRAPSHIIDEQGLVLLQGKGFSYDSSILPHYPFFKKYRGYRGKFPLSPYKTDNNILEIPVTGLIFGIPLAGTWISKLPFFVYIFLFLISNPVFLTFNLHSWDSLDSKLLLKIENILKILKNKKYQFLTGSKIHELFSKN